MLGVEIAVGVLLLAILAGFTLMVNPPSAWVTKKKREQGKREDGK